MSEKMKLRVWMACAHSEDTRCCVDCYRAAMKRVREECAAECVNTWAAEPDQTKRNALAPGCTASADAIRALPPDRFCATLAPPIGPPNEQVRKGGTTREKGKG